MNACKAIMWVFHSKLTFENTIEFLNSWKEGLNFICDKCDKKMQMECMFNDKDQHVF